MKFTVTLTDADGVVLDQWVLQRPQDNVESPWLNGDGSMDPRDGAHLGEQIAAEVNKALER